MALTGRDQMKRQVGYIYRTDGTVDKIFPEKGRKLSLKQLQFAVGGYIESLVSGIKNCRQMFCNEEGMLKNLPPNPHTWDVVNEMTYRLNGYPSSWRVLGDIIAILNEEE